MGREIKRVPLNFDWPLYKIWSGYNPPECESCKLEDGCEPSTCAHHVDPPEGEGWQLWETVSEGSPISPVFPSAEDLARWMASDEPDEFSRASSVEGALRFIRQGRAPSFVMGGGKMQSGVEYAATRENEPR